MTTNNTPNNGDDLQEEIASHVQRYKSRLLSEQQAATMLDQIRSAVLRAEPPSVVQAGHYLSILCSFVKAVAPSTGGQLRDYLSEAHLSSWISASVQRGQSRHTLSTRRGTLNRIVRASSGLPLTLDADQGRAATPAPLLHATVEALRSACRAHSSAAWRGFVAVFGSGLSEDQCLGATFVTRGVPPVLRLRTGREVALVVVSEGLGSLHGSNLSHGDWREARYVASSLGIYLDSRIIKQTNRVLALLEDASLCDVVLRYHFDEEALFSVARHLEGYIVRDSDSVSRKLREGAPTGPLVGFVGVNAPRKVIRHASTGSPRPGKALGGVVVSKKVSKAEVRRLMKELLEHQKADPEVVEPVRNFVDAYVPIGVDGDTWEKVADAVGDGVKRAGFKTVAAVKRHCTTLTLYLVWRENEGLSLALPDAMKPESIDQFYLRGLSQCGERTRNDYRSRLRTLATRVTPTVASQVPSLGYNAVRAGYITVEEAMIRRVTLGQPRPETRRRLCAIVGLGAGGGIDSQDLRYVLFEHVAVSETGMISVDVHGPKARTVVIRREYESLVLAALEGLKPGDPVVKVDGGKSNPVARIVSDATLFDDVPKIDMRRLRTTWITWLLTQRIPLDVIMAASGLTSARIIVDMISALALESDTAVLRDGGAS